ncbi:hypothetical protein Q8A67_016351 [Cirrhinus molitorella]|uniref:Uncharacterized protein n=1 Tax=Cirrhinus molitorella TaxID=172907 RepID=A0AA88TSG9_9TELE|nr:hypothetical protein Q8A67_016351 [Cirrhinus molitorella]
MKSLPKNQGRTDQILGAMADMLTSLAIPNQKWSSEGIEHLSVTQEQKTGKQRPWDTEGLNWDDMSRDSLERLRRRDRANSESRSEEKQGDCGGRAVLLPAVDSSSGLCIDDLRLDIWTVCDSLTD